jgi:XTP/dITP diphosphohydrolase
VREWLLATGNPHKVVEIGEVLSEFGIRLVRPADVGLELDPEEWGKTFAANAVIKALAFAAVSGRICLADDSGIEVEALGWEPGVFSARYGGPACDDDANNRKLVSALASVPRGSRRARYRCVIAAAFPDEESASVPKRRIDEVGPNDACEVEGVLIRTFDGGCEGAIGFEGRGTNGFGYDPWFELSDGRHMAELGSAEKHAISHRGVALRKLARHLAS